MSFYFFGFELCYLQDFTPGFSDIQEAGGYAAELEYLHTADASTEDKVERLIDVRKDADELLDKFSGSANQSRTDAERITELHKLEEQYPQYK